MSLLMILSKICCNVNNSFGQSNVGQLSNETKAKMPCIKISNPDRIKQICYQIVSLIFCVLFLLILEAEKIYSPLKNCHVIIIFF